MLRVARRGARSTSYFGVFFSAKITLFTRNSKSNFHSTSNIKIAPRLYHEGQSRRQSDMSLTQCAQARSCRVHASCARTHLCIAPRLCATPCVHTPGARVSTSVPGVHGRGVSVPLVYRYRHGNSMSEAHGLDDVSFRRRLQLFGVRTRCCFCV